jgi:uncharacterized protein involved in propanediol utilization
VREKVPVRSLRKFEESEQSISTPTFNFVYLEGSGALQVATWNLEARHHKVVIEAQVTEDVIRRVQEASASLEKRHSIAKHMNSLLFIEKVPISSL